MAWQRWVPKESNASNMELGGETVPLIQVKLVEGLFSAGQKREMVTGLTNAMVAIVGEKMRQVTWVLIEEVRGGQWGIGGEPLSAEDVQVVAGLAREVR